ncbi:Mitotic exit network component [Boothiomyces macroporosus]|uniref:Mitotic exit network component n=1 Tax=Boothiomyces macroporosus TaxID=261099 RepID=A0AAD5UK73_9FUNG|nr:Mitotic exit network component [Boothiomyces macroporosus]
MLNFFGFYNSVKLHKSNTDDHRLQNLAKSTLGSASLSKLVKLPKGEDLNEWIAVHIVDFYNQLNLLFATCQQCTRNNCPVMNAGQKYEFHWCDGVEFKRPIKLSAPEYITNLLNWVKGYIDDEQVFPTGTNQFNKKFLQTAKQIFKRLCRVYGHLYLSHFEEFEKYRVESVLNTSFKHFYFFVKEFELVPEKDYEYLKPMISKIEKN